jgi:23S rRNA pseudouridine1911/1915/1917 synthase
LDGERLDVAAARMTGLSRSRVESLLARGDVSLNSRPAAKSDRVAAGDLLEAELAEAATGVAVVPREVAGIEIVYDDADIVVVDKPAGVAAHPSLGWDGPSVVEHLAAAGFRISTSGAAERQGIVQRLDVGTSGLMVVAKSEPAYTALKQAFRSRKVEKVYQTLVQGLPDPLEGTIDAPIGRHPGADYKMAVVAGGRRAVTHYETLEAFRAATLLRVRLETGRTHQIRVHMQAIRHPVAGDPTYGGDPVLAARLGLERQWLHAVRLGFDHPVTGEPMRFESQPSADLETALIRIAEAGQSPGL